MKKTLFISCILVSILVLPKALFAGEAKGSFKEPVLVWEREFDPPLTEISAKNSAGEYIAVQGEPRRRPQKLLFLDGKGQTVREIDLTKIEKRKTPSGKTIDTVTLRAVPSGDGEYYALARSEPNAPAYWYEFAYYDKTGKLLWKFEPKENYTGPEVHISYDGSRILLIDEVVEDYFAQKWYLLDRDGKLIKNENHNLMGFHGEERNKESNEWLKYVDLSDNGEFIAYSKENKTGLMDKNGNMLWEKDFGSTQPKVDERGVVRGGKRFVNKEGKVIFEYPGLLLSAFAPSGKYIAALTSGLDKNVKIIEIPSGKTVLEVSPEGVIGRSDKMVSWPEFLSDRYLLVYIIFDIKRSAFVMDLKKQEAVWRKDNLDFYITDRSDGRELFLIQKRDRKSKTNKITVFDVSKGDGT